MMKKQPLLLSLAAAGVVSISATSVMAEPQPVATYCVDQWKGGSSEHVIGAMSGFPRDFIFTEPNGGRLIEYDDGTAHLSGLVKAVTTTGQDIDGGNNLFQIDVRLEGYTTTAPGGKAKNWCKTAPNSGCGFYPAYASGTLTGQGNYQGAVINLSRRGPAFQLGVGANAKKSKSFGASSWFNYQTISQPTTGRTIRSSGVGDFNVDLTPCDDIDPPSQTTCKVYALHDEGKTDTVLFTIDPEQSFLAEVPGSKHYPGHDLEGLALNADGELYASSGDNAVGHPKGHLYRFDFEPVTLTSIGDIIFSAPDGTLIRGAEVSALAFDSDDSLWGWAEGHGLIEIDKQTGSALLVRNDSLDCAKGGVEDIVWSNDGQTLYFVKTISPENDSPFVGDEQSTLCALSASDLANGPSVKVCHTDIQLEALEMLATGELMFAVHDKAESDLSLRSFNLNEVTPEGECTEGARVNITPPVVEVQNPTLLQTTLHDVEGIAWCRQ